MQGFDIVAGGQLAALSEFQKAFGSLQPDGSYLIPARYLSAWNSIAPACEIVSTLIYAPLLEKYGRKPGIVAASLISTVGIILQQLAMDWKVHLAGRGVNGIAIGIMFTISPLWIGESCRPEVRGFFFSASSTRVSCLDSLLCDVSVSKGSSYLTGKWQWWLPVVSMYIFPLILLIGWPFFPESSYWLVRQNNLSVARYSLKRMYGFKNDAFYETELHRMRTEIHQTTTLQRNLKTDTP
ncbi:general substrate transporter [Aspergillus crustosus]